MRQTGMAMVEALVATSLLGLGLLGASRLTLRAIDAALQNRQQEQAQALAREALECEQLSTLPCPAVQKITRQGVDYTVEIERRPLGPHLTEFSVQVQWPGAAATRQIRWHSRRSDLPGWLGVSSP